MLKSTLRLFTLGARSTSFVTSASSMTQKIAFLCCKDGKRDHKHEHEHDHKSAHQHKHEHKHGPNCNHDHHEPEPEPHVHGPNCNHHHDHDHQHHAAHPAVKLSKLTFEELIELKTDESLKYAHMIYEQEEKKLQSLKEEKEHLVKNLQFYAKVEEEIKEKEAKLTTNINNFEEEAELSKRRAEK